MGGRAGRTGTWGKGGLFKKYPSEFNSWRAMVGRCTYPTNNEYHRYGGAGVTVCPRWASSFAIFLADMGPKPSPQHSINRVGGALVYCKENCRWATKAEQNADRKPYKKRTWKYANEK